MLSIINKRIFNDLKYSSLLFALVICILRFFSAFQVSGDIGVQIEASYRLYYGEGYTSTVWTNYEENRPISEKPDSSTLAIFHPAIHLLYF